VEVSSGEDDVPRPTTSADKLKKLAVDDAEDRECLQLSRLLLTRLVPPR
jgi:hypothetical protein